MKLSPITQQFVLHWGEMGARWGVNRTVAQIHALLYMSENALTADEITETLGVARSNVSNSIKELLSWRLVKVVHVMGDRRDHFETSKDVWELFKLIVAGRKQREIDPTLQIFDELLSSPDFNKESPHTRQRIEETQQFIRILTQWSDEMLRLEPETLMKVLKLGAKISNLIRRDTKG
ncbi:MAG: MarR family transcriptional regulator [Candidatus Thiodiazotropha sp.]